MTIPKSISDGPILSTANVAKKVGVHRSTVWLWIKRGMLKSERHGESGAFHGVRPAALERFLSIYEIVPANKRKRKTKPKAKRRRKANPKRRRKASSRKRR